MYSIGTKTFAILEIAMPHLVLLKKLFAFQGWDIICQLFAQFP
jgi:hypothetical protein